MVVDGGKWRPFRFRSPSGMTSFSVSAILDEVTSTGSDLTGNGKWGHPRWWPEAERPPFSTIHHHGVPKTHPVFWMTSVGRSDSLKTSYRRLPPPWLITTWSHMFFRDTLKYLLMMSDSFFWGFWKHLIVSLTQALSKWLSKLPACYYGEVTSLHLSTPCPMENCYSWDMVLTSASTYSTLFFFYFYFFNIF